MRLTLRLKGGEGSGNHGHAGRPGLVGGSAPDGITWDVGPKNSLADFNSAAEMKAYVASKGLTIHHGYVWNGDKKVGYPDDAMLVMYGDMTKTSIDTIASKAPAASTSKVKEERASLDDIPIITYSGKNKGRGYMLTGDDRLIDVTSDFGGGTNDHVGAFVVMDNPEIFGLTKDEAKKFAKAYDNASGVWLTKGWDKIFKSNAIRVRQFEDTVYVETPKIDKATLRRLQKLHDANKFNAGKKMVWESYNSFITGDAAIEATAEEFLSAKYIVDGELKEHMTSLL